MREREDECNERAEQQKPAPQNSSNGPAQHYNREIENRATLQSSRTEQSIAEQWSNGAEQWRTRQQNRGAEQTSRGTTSIISVRV